eukprot:CAMPEP_0184981294 /NCGR_PEP_ID=MMETSP1098-20130426/11079_1 /TAXON_ID=89044 /ORGANISM="Spumella elongata, Strain CCAP 955/1" /LENGTH=204 /DNA_ID=CAMNT_0027504845 /DNA_START=80 /DNA_END=694 /DNA_ORIENTATION=+
MDSKPREVKVVLLGDSGVGKSSLVLRFVTNNFKPYSESTIGASFMSKMITVSNKQIKFQIWDTAGQEKYHSLAPMYYRGAAAAIVVYDITRASSFKTLKHWVEELKTKGPKDIAIAIAGNKADLHASREVDQEMAMSYAEEIGALYLETSAKDDTNVQDIFVKLSFRLPQPQTADASVIRATNNTNRSNTNAQSNNAGGSGGCC